MVASTQKAPHSIQARSASEWFGIWPQNHSLALRARIHIEPVSTRHCPIPTPRHQRKPQLRIRRASAPLREANHQPSLPLTFPCRSALSPALNTSPKRKRVVRNLPAESHTQYEPRSLIALASDSLERLRVVRNLAAEPLAGASGLYSLALRARIYIESRTVRHCPIPTPRHERKLQLRIHCASAPLREANHQPSLPLTFPCRSALSPALNTSPKRQRVVRNLRAESPPNTTRSLSAFASESFARLRVVRNLAAEPLACASGLYSLVLILAGASHPYSHRARIYRTAPNPRAKAPTHTPAPHPSPHPRQPTARKAEPAPQPDQLHRPSSKATKPPGSSH
ncbi:hypothetical protein MFFC18_13360 [Mariniblastus fucicola]|uniref:Uncharacterized protein n=1 Tax=Mariniblastus fucicola TaxID=980251 RepID=A0A5B9P9B1_9BACT|nr:hypothetical protein MFFC18_13360 [Mariniblastus fucicola]